MNAIFSMGVGEWWQLTGWTMVHFLWLGTLIGVAAFIARISLRSAAPPVRYGVAVAALGILAVLPVSVFAWLVAKPQAAATLPVEAKTQAAVETSRVSRPVVVPGDVARSTQRAAGVETSRALTPPESSAALPDVVSPAAFDASLADFTLDAAVRYLPWLWIVGTPLTFGLLATGLIGAERLRRSSRIVDDGPIADACAQLALAMRVGRRVSVAICERIAAPVLVGIVRPVILLPPSAISGWSPEEIEMALVHELAHVRRWDNLVNLLQRFAESLLFFHPAVWLVSNWVRREREACCDAVVVEQTQRPHAYAEMLVALAAQMPRSVLFHPAATSAMAARPLRGRVRRILGIDDDPMLVSGKSLAVVMSGLLLAATLVVLNLPTHSRAEESTTESTEGTESNGDVSEERAREYRTQNNLKALVLGLHNYADSRKYFPPVANFDANGKPLLSWRVNILPFLGEEAAKLYNEFHRDEPWDSVHNKKLIARMPKVFKNPRLDEPGVTNYLAVVGDECVFTGINQVITFAQISDGTSRTIALVEADADLAVPWTKPQDWAFDRDNPTAGLGSFWKDHWYGARADGSVHRVENSESPDAVGIQFTRAGGETDSLRESEGRAATQEPFEMGGDRYGAMAGLADGAFADARELGGEFGSQPAAPPRKFPSLEDQKLADLLWRRMSIELEPIVGEDLQRVKALGYEGGVKVKYGRGDLRGPGEYGQIQFGDILVGLHAWPTRSLQAVADVLSRDDLAELNPLKFYVVRKEQVYEPADIGSRGGMRVAPKMKDQVVTGRISVDVSPSVTSARTPLTREEMEEMVKGGRGTAKSVLQPTPNYYPLPPLRRAVPGETPPPINPADYGRVWPAQAVAAETALSEPGSKQSNDLLRYDGRTFDQWRTAWRTELSTEKRLEAVRALAAFGAHGYGREATEAILEVVEQLDWSTFDNSSLADQLKQACVDAFTTGSSTGYAIPIDVSLPILISSIRAEDGPAEGFNWLVIHQLSRSRIDSEVVVRTLVELSRDEANQLLAFDGLKQLDPMLQDERILQRLKQAIEEASDNPTLQMQLLHHLICVDNSRDPGDRIQAPYVPALDSLLFHDDTDVRRHARWVVSHLDSAEAGRLADEALAVAEDESRSEADRLAAIRALVAMGRVGEKEAAALRPLAHGPPSPLRDAAAYALNEYLVDTEGRSLYKDVFGKETTDRETTEELREILDREEEELFPDGVTKITLGGGGFF